MEDIENIGLKKEDLITFTLLNISLVGHYDDPFMLASCAKQFFYVDDPIDKIYMLYYNHYIKNFMMKARIRVIIWN